MKKNLPTINFMDKEMLYRELVTLNTKLDLVYNGTHIVVPNDYKTIIINGKNYINNKQVAHLRKKEVLDIKKFLVEYEKEQLKKNEAEDKEILNQLQEYGETALEIIYLLSKLKTRRYKNINFIIRNLR